MNASLNEPITEEMLNATFKGCWKIQARAPEDKSGNRMYQVACVHCGDKATFQHGNLKTGHTRACKCLKEKKSGLSPETNKEICNQLIKGLNSVDNPENLIERAFEDIGLQKEVQELREEAKNLKIESRNKGIAINEKDTTIKDLSEKIKDLEAQLEITKSQFKIKEMLEVTRKASYTQKVEEMKIKEVTLNRELEKLGIRV